MDMGGFLLQSVLGVIDGAMASLTVVWGLLAKAKYHNAKERIEAAREALGKAREEARKAAEMVLEIDRRA